MAKETRVILAVVTIIPALSSGLIAGDIAVSFSDWSDAGWPVAGTNHGWQFTVNEPIVVTHLGLFDDWPDGFEIDHPIGLWRLSDSALLVSGTMNAGTGDTLLDNFRYIDVPDVALDVGVDYVIGYYSASDPYTADRNILKAEGLQVDPAIDIVVRRWSDVVWQLQMPGHIYEWHPGPPYEMYNPDCFGPNFQFIPEPGTILLLGLGGLILRRRKR